MQASCISSSHRGTIGLLFHNWVAKLSWNKFASTRNDRINLRGILKFMLNVVVTLGRGVADHNRSSI